MGSKEQILGCSGCVFDPIVPALAFKGSLHISTDGNSYLRSTDWSGLPDVHWDGIQHSSVLHHNERPWAYISSRRGSHGSTKKGLDLCISDWLVSVLTYTCSGHDSIDHSCTV